MWRSTDQGVQDRRRTTRYAASGVVQIQDAIGGSLHDCRLTDISDGGVRLYAERLAVPDDFILYLPAEHGRRRRCRVVWRLGHEVGAKFTDRAPAAFGKNAALAQFGQRG